MAYLSARPTPSKKGSYAPLTVGLGIEPVETDSFYDLHATGQAPLVNEAHFCKVGS